MILDTNALSAFFDGDSKLRQVVSNARELCLPVIVLGEYRFGLMHSRERKKIEPAFAAFATAARVLAVDTETVQPYAEICSELKRAGKPLPSNDIWIAALARQYSLPVVSQDAHFDHVRGIQRLAW
jgi:predicted nucleic acid-binding protein